MNSSKKIEINKSTLVSLKAELCRKQQEVSQAKTQSQFTRPSASSSGTKKPSIWSKKNLGVESRNERDVEELAEEQDALSKSRKALEAKAELYGRLSKAGAPRSETVAAQSVSLVDFRQKQREDERQQRLLVENEEVEEEGEFHSDDYDKDVGSDDDWVDYTDCLGRTRRCLRADLTILKEQDTKLASSLGMLDAPEGDRQPEEELKEEVPRAPSPPLEQKLVSGIVQRETLRAKWEQQEEELKHKDSVHYQDVLFDEVRSHGVSYFKFSSDEAERRTQQTQLEKVREETRRRQEQAKDARKLREQQLRARLRAAANRKREREGLPPLSDADFEKGGGDSDEEAEVERLLKSRGREESSESQKEPEPLTREERPAPAQPRPWDLHKEKRVMSQEEWNKHQRSQRVAEFAPPTTSYGFHSGGQFQLTNDPTSSRNSSSKRDRHDALRLPRKPQKRLPSSSSDSDDEVIGPLPPGPTAPPKKSAKTVAPLPDTSVPPPRFQFSFPPPNLRPQSSSKPSSNVSWVIDHNPEPSISAPCQPPLVNKPSATKVNSSSSDEDVQEVRGRGAEIAPPTSMDYHLGAPKRSAQRKPGIASKTEVETSIAAGLDFLRQQASKKNTPADRIDSRW